MTDTSVLAVLSRALIHVVRGDLSVITNDLSYLESLVPKGEVERAKARCVNIAQFVGKLSILQSGPKPQTCALGMLFKTGLGAEELDAERSDCVICCDVQQMKFVFATIAALIVPSEALSTNASVVRGEESECKVLITSPRTEEIVGSYPTLSEFAMRARGERSVVDAALCDIVLHAHGYQCHVAVMETKVEASIEMTLSS